MWALEITKMTSGLDKRAELDGLEKTKMHVDFLTWLRKVLKK